LDSVKIKAASKRAYHHGDLRRELLAAAEAIILERGVDGFTLREAARRVGVSPAAPAHHFKDARGLLTEVAMLGFRDFGQALEAADRRGGEDPARRLAEQGRAYVDFALDCPARFQLMFRPEKLDQENAALAAAAYHSYGVLEAAIRVATGTPAGSELSPDGHGLLLAVWSVVHGFAHLALGGQLRDPAGEPVGREAMIDTLLPLMLRHLPAARTEL